MELLRHISNLISVKSNRGRYCLRSYDNGILLNIPTCKSFSTLGDRSFSTAAHKLWNSLPADIRNASYVHSFKRSLKTYFYQEHIVRFLAFRLGFLFLQAYLFVYVLHLPGLQHLQQPLSGYRAERARWQGSNSYGSSRK